MMRTNYILLAVGASAAGMAFGMLTMSLLVNKQITELDILVKDHDDFTRANTAKKAPVTRKTTLPKAEG